MSTAQKVSHRRERTRDTRSWLGWSLAAPLGAIAVLVVLSLSGCSVSSPGDARPKVLVAEVASYDLSPDRSERFIVGLFAADRGDVALGEVEVSFAYIGPLDPAAPAIPSESPPSPTTAQFLPIPGAPQFSQADPTFDAPPGVRGVYGTGQLRFDVPGVWEITVAATIDGSAQTATAFFEVFETSLVPGPGDRAPHTQQPLPGDPAVEPKAIDSRLEFNDDLPDPALHRRTISEALEEGRPVMVVVSTPVFCVSRYCGPITDELARLSESHGEAMEFVHLEVWESFEENRLNASALEWIGPIDPSEAAEPWVFLVDETGTIVRRWDNLASTGELQAAIADLLNI